MDIKSTLSLSQFEYDIKRVLNETYRNERPSKKTLNAIMCFAASYECKDTKIGKVEFMLN